MRYDLISPRENKNGKTHWHKVGAAFPRDKGGFSIVLDSLPLPDKEGRVSLLMTEAKPYEGGGQQREQERQQDHGAGAGGRPSGGGYDMGGDGDDDSIPF